jgi:hypothetical protein
MGGTEKRTRTRREDRVTLRHAKLQDERGARGGQIRPCAENFFAYTDI